jgi:type I restriction enzyme S subunit
MIPKDWKKERLGNTLLKAQPGFACGDRDPQGTIQLRMNNVDTRGNLLLEEYIRVPTDKVAIEKYRLLPGDVVFNNTNSTELVGKSALFRGFSEPIVFSNHFTRLRVAPDKLYPAYLAAWLQYQWQSRVLIEAKGREVAEALAILRDGFTQA